MSRVAASLAAARAVLAIAAGGDGGAEPGASEEATLVLDFTPNAVHTGLYAALAGEEFEREGIELEIREPSASTDGPKLLEAGRADLAVLDIHDLAIARERGLDLVGVGAIVQRPLAAVIAGDRAAIRTPADLEGGTAGVTGLPSDDAVLDSVLEAGGANAATVERVTIGFDSIAALSAGRVDAATAFWNAEGVALRRLGVRTREFRVDDFGAPPYPELVLVTTAATLAQRADLIERMLAAIGRGQGELAADPDGALADLLEAVPELSAGEQRAQLEALLSADAIGASVRLDEGVLQRWAAWDAERGIVKRPPRVDRAFELGLAPG
jgi:putative hydroxymethylpyrimidine transport system substrate-binding protein